MVVVAEATFSTGFAHEPKLAKRAVKQPLQHYF
jgi:hypothetical protein